MCVQRPRPADPLLKGIYAYLGERAVECPHGVIHSDVSSDAEVCDDCNENLAAEQAEGSVGK